MLRWLSRLLGRPAQGAEDDSLDRVVPMLVPGSFAESGHWPGPIYRLAAPGFAQTWVVLGEGSAITYVNRAIQAQWENAGAPWRERADANLRRLAKEHPYNGMLDRPDGSLFLATMLFNQALGPARLLVPHLLDAAFPDGYLVAMPEMTCALAFRLDLSEEEEAKVSSMIDGCFEHGTEPVARDRIAPEAFWRFDSADVGVA